MKRFLVGLLLTLGVAGLTFGAARTASVDGLWNATATWGGAAVPGLSDSCTINSGIEVVCDTDPCQCGDLTVTGSLTFKDGARTLKLGNATQAAGDGDLTITAATGSVILGAGQDIEFNCDRSTETAACELTNNGTLVVSGNRIFTGGKITAIGAITDGGASRYILLTDTGNVQSIADLYAGKYLVPTSGYFRNHFFEILSGCTNAATNTVCVDMDTRGALDTRNTVNNVTPQAWKAGDWGSIKYIADGDASDMRVENAATKVEFDAGVFLGYTPAEVARLATGSRLICATDLDVVADTDFRRVCTVCTTDAICTASGTPCSCCSGSGAGTCDPDGTGNTVYSSNAPGVVLCTAYGTASCAGPTGAGLYILSDNQPPKSVIIQEAFRIGDTYEIIDPAIISITSGNRSDTSPLDHWNLIANSGSNTLLRDVRLDYCGQDLDGGSSSLEPSCLYINGVDNSLDSEQFLITRADIWHWSGEAAIHTYDSDNLAIERVNIHDCSEGGEADAHECHGIYIEDDNNSSNTGFTVRNNRIMRVNDAALAVTGDPTSGIVCTDCTFTNNQIGFIPANGQGNGSSGTGITVTGSMVNSRVGDNFMTNIADRAVLIDPTDTSPNTGLSIAVDHNMLLNTQMITVGYAGDFSATTGTPDSLSRIAFVNNVMVGYTQGVQRGYLYSNFMMPLNAQVAATEAGCGYEVQGAFGNICMAAGGSSGNAPLGFSMQPTSAGLATLFPTTAYIQDNAVYGSTTPQASGTTYVLAKLAANAVTSYNHTVDHNTVVCQERHTTSTDLQAIQTAPAASGTTAVSNNVAYDCSRFINEAATGTLGVTASSYNLRLLVTSVDADVDSTSNDLTTGIVSFEQMQAGDLSCNEGSTPWSSLGSDGYPRGVRVAGPPNPASFLALYPFPLIYDPTGLAVRATSDVMLQITNANTIGDKDTDGDGVWDLHDNCDGAFNPSQLDTDADGKGDACDR